MQDSTPQPTGSPTSWRDVYSLVQDSERRLTQTITDGFTRQAAVSTDHEVRLRAAEASIGSFHSLVEQGTAQQKDIMADWTGWRKDISREVEDMQDSDLMKEARRGGIMAVGTKAKAALLVVVGIVGPVVTTLLLRIAFPPS